MEHVDVEEVEEEDPNVHFKRKQEGGSRRKRVDCKIKVLRILPCSFGLTGRVHEEECDESFSVVCLVTKNCAHFF